jgi:hypothetical protein
MTAVIRWGCAVFSLVALAALAPGLARAQPTAVGLIGTFLDTETSISGVAGGQFIPTGFDSEDHTLVLSGTGLVAFCVPNVDPKNCSAGFELSLTMPVIAIGATCDAVSVTLGPVEAIAGVRFVLDLHSTDPVVLSGSSRQFRCALARRVGSNEPLFTLAGALNTLF